MPQYLLIFAKALFWNPIFFNNNKKQKNSPLPLLEMSGSSSVHGIIIKIS
jgi:hypothetical protein